MIRLPEAMQMSLGDLETEEELFINCKVWDIPQTLIGYINSLPPNTKLVSIRMDTAKNMRLLNAVARKRGITIAWVKSLLDWGLEEENGISDN